MSREKKTQLFKFPLKGINVVYPRNEQPEGTTIDAQNVRPFDTLEERGRGGSRPGLDRYNGSAINGSNRIQDINYVTTINTSLGTSGLSRRTIIPVAVSDGVIAKFDTASITNATVSGSQSLGNSTQAPFAFSAELFGRLYYADGYGYKIYVGSNNAAIDWTPTAGSLPGDVANSNTCRLIEQWRGRIVMSGLSSDPHNWYMSKLGDPLDWEYFPTPETEIDAVQGGNGVIGKVPDVINAIIPYSDDVIIFGCDHSIWMMSGDPQAGGRLDLVTSTVGMAFGRPYTQLPDGSLVFFSNRGSVYRMPPGGGKPQNITEDSIDPLITNTNLNTSLVRLAYDEDAEGIHVYISPITTGAATHWFWDIRNEGWFKVVFGANNHNPISLLIFDGDDPNDRTIMLGSENGFINIYNTSSFDDNGDDFTSFVIMGPIVEQSGKIPTVLTDLQIIMDAGSASVKYEIAPGDTAESAIDEFTATFQGNTEQYAAGTADAGKSVNFNPRSRGYFQYFKIGQTAATGPWAIEYIQATYKVVGSSRGRQFLTDVITFFDPAGPPQLSQNGLYAAFWAEKNVTQSGGTMTAWTPYQRGSGVTTFTFSNTTSTKPTYSASDSTLNSKPSIGIGNAVNRRLRASIASNTNLNTGHGFITMAFYSANTAAGSILVFDGATTAEGVSLNTTGVPEFQTKDDFGAGNSQTANTAWVVNTAYIVTWAAANPNGPWKIWQNNTEVLSVNLGKWWDNSDDGTNNVLMTWGDDDLDFYLGAFAIYTTYNTTIIDSVESEMASHFGITLA